MDPDRDLPTPPSKDKDMPPNKRPSLGLIGEGYHPFRIGEVPKPIRKPPYLQREEGILPDPQPPHIGDPPDDARLPWSPGGIGVRAPPNFEGPRFLQRKTPKEDPEPLG